MWVRVANDKKKEKHTGRLWYTLCMEEVVEGRIVCALRSHNEHVHIGMLIALLATCNIER